MRRFFNNLLLILGSSITNSVAAFLFTAYAAQQLGSEVFGKFSTVQIYVTSLIVFTEIGLMQVIVREVAQNRDQTEHIASNSIAIKTGFGFLGFFIAILFSNILDYDNTTKSLIAIFSLSLLFGSISNSCVAIFNGHEKMIYSTVPSVSSALGFLASIVALFLQYDLIIVFSILTVSSFLSALISLIFLHFQFKVSHFFAFERPFYKKLLIAAFPFGILSVFNRIGVSFGPIALSQMVGETEVGYYNVAYKIINILFLLISAYNLTIYPVFSRLGVSSTAKLHSAYNLSMKVMLALGLPVSVGVTVAAPQIVNFLFPRYEQAIPVLQILIWFLFFALMTTPTNNMLYAMGKQKKAAFIMFWAMVVSISLNLLLIPFFGPRGVAAALTVFVGVQFLGSYVIVSKDFVVAKPLNTIIKISLVSGAILATGVLLISQHLFITILAMTVIFVIGILTSNILSDEELEILSDVPLIILGKRIRYQYLNRR